jgi:hypothetical protein
MYAFIYIYIYIYMYICIYVYIWGNILVGTAVIDLTTMAIGTVHIHL